MTVVPDVLCLMYLMIWEYQVILFLMLRTIITLHTLNYQQNQNHNYDPLGMTVVYSFTRWVRDRISSLLFYGVYSQSSFSK